MTNRTSTEEEPHQPQRSVMLPVASGRRDVKDLPAEGVTAGFTRTKWSEPAPAPDLGLPLATIESHQRGDRVPKSGGVRRVAVTGLRVPDPHSPPPPSQAPRAASGAAHPE